MSANLTKLQDCFAIALGISKEQIVDSLAYNGIKEWDSVGHMALMSEIESAFDIMLDTDDILGLSTFAKTKEILAKYGVEI